MGLDLGTAVNSGTDWLGRAPAVRLLVGTPLATAAFLTALALVIFVGLREAPRAEGKKKTARAALYFFLAAFAVQLLHHALVTRAAATSSAQEGLRSVVTSVQESQGSPGSVPVRPMAAGGGRDDGGRGHRFHGRGPGSDDDDGGDDYYRPPPRNDFARPPPRWRDDRGDDRGDGRGDGRRGRDDGRDAFPEEDDDAALSGEGEKNYSISDAIRPVEVLRRGGEARHRRHRG